MKTYDLVVAGAGPAGLTLAWKAAERGLRVLVFDKKRHSGDIAYTTSASFIDLERWELPDDVAQRITKIHFSSARAVIELPVTACVLRRRLLLAELEKRCLGYGAHILYSNFAKKIDVLNESITSVSLADRTVVAGKTYADCSGLGKVFNRVLPVNRGSVTRALGYEVIVPLKSEPHTVDLYVGGDIPGGYGWLFPVSEKHAIVGVGILRSEGFRRIRELLDLFLKLPRTSERVEGERLESHAGVFSTGRPLARFHRGNLVIVGDVALQGNPAAGEGIRFVMDSAEMASRAIVRAVESGDMRFLGEYSKAWTDKYFRDFRANFKLQRILYRLTGTNRLLDFMIRAGAKASDETIVTLIKGEASPRFLLRKFPKLLYRPFLS